MLVCFNFSSGKSTLSASGILLPGSSANQINGGKDAQWLPGSALVVTVASIVEPFLSLQHRENMSQVGLVQFVINTRAHRLYMNLYGPIWLVVLRTMFQNILRNCF